MSATQRRPAASSWLSPLSGVGKRVHLTSVVLGTQLACVVVSYRAFTSTASPPWLRSSRLPAMSCGKAVQFKLADERAITVGCVIKRQPLAVHMSSSESTSKPQSTIASDKRPREAQTTFIVFPYQEVYTYLQKYAPWKRPP